MKIEYFDRESKETKTEKVYGEKFVEWLYQSSLGKGIAPVLVGKTVSQLYGVYQDTQMSASKVAPFVEKFDINLSEYTPNQAHEFRSFNDFFIRRFRDGVRNFPEEKGQMGAFCEARYFGYESFDDEATIPVKGHQLRPLDLLGRRKWSPYFEGGPLVIARLCPVDYHRYHFPDKGEVLESYPVHGKYHSVNPLALKSRPDIFITNERHVSILQTENFGKLAYIEVGAICVGKIVQSYKGSEFERGQEKGYFLFGGSTVIVLGEPGRWRPSEDILQYTKNGKETYIKLGDTLGDVVTRQ